MEQRPGRNGQHSGQAGPRTTSKITATSENKAKTMESADETNVDHLHPPNSAQHNFCPWRQDSTASLAIRSYAQRLERATHSKDEAAEKVSANDIETAIGVHAKNEKKFMINDAENPGDEGKIETGDAGISNDDGGGMAIDGLEPRSTPAVVSLGSIDDWDDHCCHLICQLEVYADYLSEARMRVESLLAELRSDEATWEGDQNSRAEFLKRFLHGVHFDDDHIVFDKKLWFQLKGQASQAAKKTNFLTLQVLIMGHVGMYSQRG